MKKNHAELHLELNQAYAWYTIAGGEIELDSTKDALAQKMTPEQIARAQELSTELDKKINEAK